MKLSGNVLGLKRMKTDEFGHNSCIINEVTKMTEKYFFFKKKFNFCFIFDLLLLFCFVF